MSKVVHLIPYDGIGGVESAARSMGSIHSAGVHFEIDYIFHTINSSRQRLVTNNPLYLLGAVKRGISDNVDVLIVSLWRSCIVGLLAKLLKPSLKLVVFIHSDKDAHWIDYVFTRMAVFLSIEVWADSKSSLSNRLPNLNSNRGKVISFVTHYFEPLIEKSVSPEFIFWGRISAEKGVDRALKIFASIHKAYPNAVLKIIGPDGGELFATQTKCSYLGLDESVVFLGSMNFNDIKIHARHASFYLQTSLFEGMGMSVVEAMQMGLVPIVTAVGEIARYCVSDKNAVIVESDEKTVEAILDLLTDDPKYQMLRKNAISLWVNKPLYADSMMNACQLLLKKV